MRQRRTPRPGRVNGSGASRPGESAVDLGAWVAARRLHLASIVVAAVAGACYLPSLRNQFAFDDRSVCYQLQLHACAAGMLHLKVTHCLRAGNPREHGSEAPDFFI